MTHAQAQGARHAIEDSGEDPVFLTQLCNVDDDTKQQLKLLYQESIRTYNELNELIQHIDSHFLRTLTAYEQDFLTAYKGQMLRVEKELIFMREKQKEFSGKLMGDNEIVLLQQQITWFKKTAQELNRMIDRQREQMESAKLREVTTKKDEQFLAANLKSLKLENKQLRMQAEIGREKVQKLDAWFEENDRGDDDNFDPECMLA
jgi:hypothetical protein